MNLLTFNIKPSTESNDHEIRIIIDGNDLLGEDYLGLDPPDFFRQKTLFENGELAIGRCICGCVGCDDVWVKVCFSDNDVVWTTERDEKFSFDKEDYLKCIKDTSTDFSWETLGRKVERLVSKIFVDKIIEGKYSFNWASTRISPNIVSLSFSSNGEQKLYHFLWNGETMDSAIENAQLFIEKTLNKNDKA